MGAWVWVVGWRAGGEACRPEATWSWLVGWEGVGGDGKDAWWRP